MEMNMLMPRKALIGLLLTAVLTLMPGLASPLPPRDDGYGKVVAHGSDARQFMGELRSGGALQFYEDTEEIIRAGKFERAYLRLIFLRAHIRGLPLETGLVPMVDQRLRFLREQLRLGEGVDYAAREERPVRRTRHVKPVCPPCPPPKAKAPPEEKPPEVIIPPGVPENKAAAPPPAEAKPPGAEAPKPATPGTPAPAPAPSFWDKAKRKLKFW
jgi:hypothetical protein